MEVLSKLNCRSPNTTNTSKSPKPSKETSKQIKGKTIPSLLIQRNSSSSFSVTNNPIFHFFSVPNVPLNFSLKHFQCWWNTENSSQMKPPQTKPKIVMAFVIHYALTTATQTKITTCLHHRLSAARTQAKRTTSPPTWSSLFLSSLWFLFLLVSTWSNWNAMLIGVAREEWTTLFPLKTLKSFSMRTKLNTPCG